CTFRTPRFARVDSDMRPVRSFTLDPHRGHSRARADFDDNELDAANRFSTGGVAATLRLGAVFQPLTITEHQDSGPSQAAAARTARQRLAGAERCFIDVDWLPWRGPNLL